MLIENQSLAGKFRFLELCNNLQVQSIQLRENSSSKRTCLRTLKDLDKTVNVRATDMHFYSLFP